MKNWNLKQYKDAMLQDIQHCNNAFEVSMVKAIAGKEIREKAIEFSKIRRLTPAEIAIASEFGYKG